MARLVENIDELIQEIGPRPVGTQQEHQAAELIAARLDEMGLRVDIEEFPCARNLGWVRVLYFALSSIGAAIVVFSPSIRIIGVIAVLIGVILLLLDYLGKNPLFTLFNNSLSQNVIARYLPPGADPSGRSRKVIVLAHYDSARTTVQAAPPLAPYFTQLRQIVRLAAIALIPLVVLIMIPFPLDIITRIISIVTVIAAVPVLLGMLAETINFFMPYSQGANCNGSGVGVLFGLARALATGEDITSTRSTTRQGSARRGRRNSRAAERGAGIPEADERGGRRIGDDGLGASGGGRLRQGRTRQGRAVGTDALGRTGRDGLGRGGSGSLGSAGEILAAGSAKAGEFGGVAEILDSRVSARVPATADFGVDATNMSAASFAGAAADTAAFAGTAAGVTASTRVTGATASADAATDAATIDIGARKLSAVETRERDMAAAVRPREGGRRRTAAQTADGGYGVGPSGTEQGFGLEHVEHRPTQQVFGVEVPIDALIDNTTSPFVKPRAASVDVERQAELERAVAQRQRQAAAGPQRDDAGKPAWFLKAKQNAEKKAQSQQGTEDGGITRSRFADVPVSGEEARLKVAAKAAPFTNASEPAGSMGGAVEAAGGGVLEDTGVIGMSDGVDISDAGAVYLAAANAADIAAAPAAAAGAEAGGYGLPAAADGSMLQPMVPSVAATMPADGIMPGDARAVRLPAERMPSQPASQRPATITVNPDLSGIDRQAFKVLQAEQQQGQTVIVPTEAEAVLPGAAGGAAAAAAGAADAASSADVDGGAQPGIAGVPHTIHTQNASRPMSRLRNRLSNLPNLSLDNTGNVPTQQATLDTAPVAKEELFAEDNSPISSTGAFIPLGTTGIMKPVGDELLQYAGGGDIYVQDADDTAIEDHYSEEGHYSAPELVNIPDSRVKSFLGSVGDRLSGKKKEKLDDSPSSWLGVDQEFNARREGHDIGTWNNFGSEDDSWNGGAYGGDSYDDNAQAMMQLSKELLDKEVWLVALGANESRNAGLDNLFANHGNEIKNALFINLLGVGVGDLVFTISEGEYRPLQTDHRMQNLIGSAAQNMSIPIAPVEFKAFATDGTQTLRQGGRAISIIGMGRHLPVGWKWRDDDVSRLEEDNLLDVMSLVLETIKSS